jgi:hypothetical protein
MIMMRLTAVTRAGFFCLAAVAAFSSLSACSDDKDDVQTLSPTTLATMTDFGPTETTFRLVSMGTASGQPNVVLYNVKVGGNPLLGLEKQPSNPKDSIVQMEVWNHACSALEYRMTGVANTEWELNADVTLNGPFRACDRKIMFQLLVETNTKERIFHTFRRAVLLSASGVRLPLEVVDGPNGHKMVKSEF